MGKPISPLFNAEPVIVIHFGTDHTEEGRTLAACCGEVFYPDNGDSYKSIPRVPCSGCMNAAKKVM